MKATTRNQLVFWFSPRPVLVPMAYFIISPPWLVAVISGLSARRPTRVSLANELLRAVVEKLRLRVEGILRRRANILAVGLGEIFGGGRTKLAVCKECDVQSDSAELAVVVNVELVRVARLQTISRLKFRSGFNLRHCVDHVLISFFHRANRGFKP
jgi:hypothetical protein